MHPGSEEPTKRGLLVRATDDGLDVIVRNNALLSLSEEELADNSEGVLQVSSNFVATTVEVVGTSDEGEEYLSATTEADVRPQITGIYTDLPADGDAAAAVAAGLDVNVVIDSRFTSEPTTIKYLVMFLGLLMALASLVALRIIDRVDGSKPAPLLPGTALRPRVLDGIVVATLVLWHIIGANTSDDGYIFAMARVSEDSGYMANYFRWFGAPESPFGWPILRHSLGDGQYLHRFDVDATARAAVRTCGLVCNLPDDHSAPGLRDCPAPGGLLVRRWLAAGVLAALQQRAAPERHCCLGLPFDLGVY